VTLASVYANQGRYDEAAAEYQAVIESLERSVGPDHFDLTGPHHNLANVLMMQRKWDRAIEHCERALEIERLVFGHEHPRVATSMSSLAIAQRSLGRLDEAEEILRESLRILEATTAPEDLGPSYPRTQLAFVLLDQGRATEALEPARLAWEKRKGTTLYPLVAESAFAYAKGVLESGPTAAERAEAVALARESLQLFTCVGPVGDDYRVEIVEWMKSHRIARPRFDPSKCPDPMTAP
jgi:tetratricopeptide (TPR) repeat protein